ncbi:unnamed protein product [Schistosoma curassoni]|nr:unnamed protein product [Schistosoma curassoni]
MGTLVVSAYSPTDCSSDDVKDELYRKLSYLLRKARRSDVVIVAGDFNAQVGKLSDRERHLGGSYSIMAQKTDDGDRLLQLCSDNRPFLANTNFKHKEKHLLTWRPPNSSQRWTQIDHIAISHRSRDSIEDCRSFWSTCLNSDHALVRARICLRLTGRRKDAARKPLRSLLNDSQAKSIFQEQIENRLGSHVCDAHPEAAWNDIRKAVETAVISASKVNHKVREQHWISAASIALIDARKLIPPGSEHNEERSQLKRKLTRSLRNNREQWWVAKTREVEKAAAIVNSRQLFRLVKETVIRNPTVSETLPEKDGHIIHSQSRRLDRWAGHFRDQFNWPSAILRLPTISS